MFEDFADLSSKESREISVEIYGNAPMKNVSHFPLLKNDEAPRSRVVVHFSLHPLTGR